MSLQAMQQEVEEWTKQYKLQYWKPHEVLARLTEEVGELAREVNARWGPKKKKSDEETKEIGDELADILFTVCCLANPLNINLDEHFQRAMDKCYGRDSERYERK